MDYKLPPMAEHRLKAEKFSIQAILEYAKGILSPGSPLNLQAAVLDEQIVSLKMLAWGREVCIEQGPTRTVDNLTTHGPFWIPRTLNDKTLAVGVDVLRAINALFLRWVDHRAATSAAKALRRWRRSNIRFDLRYSRVVFSKTSTIEVHHKHFCPHIGEGQQGPHLAFLLGGNAWHGSVDQYEAMKKVIAACLDARQRYLDVPAEYRRSAEQLPYPVQVALKQYENDELLHRNYDYASFLKGESSGSATSGK